MSGEMSEEAPVLGEPTDAAVSDEAAAILMKGGRPGQDDDTGAEGDPEETVETPDELGGTGGEQAGGAG